MVLRKGCVEAQTRVFRYRMRSGDCFHHYSKLYSIVETGKILNFLNDCLNNAVQCAVYLLIERQSQSQSQVQSQPKPRLSVLRAFALYLTFRHRASSI